MIRRQRGIALMTAILVVAIATLAATALLVSSSIAVQRTGSLRDSEQAWWYAQGVEAWILGILEKDAQDNDFDGLGEPWAIPVSSLPVDEGTACGAISDLQGRFNLNNLAAAGSVDYALQFKRLLANLPDSEAPPELAAAVRDWLDADDTPGMSGGAEDMAYLDRQPPYRAANRLFTNVSELLAVQGMTPELYRMVAPLLAALPRTGTPVNVNTAPEEVLRALSDTVDSTKLQQFLEQRLAEPAKTVDEFINKGILGADAPRTTLEVRSTFFLLQGSVFVGSGHVALYCSIFRPDPGKPLVFGRSTVPELPGSHPCATPSTSS